MTPYVRRGRSRTVQPGKATRLQSRARKRQSDMNASYPGQPPISDADAPVAPHQIRVLEAQVRPVKMRRRVQSWIDCWLKPGKAIVPRCTHVQMRVQSSLQSVGHQDFHLSDRQILDVLVLSPSLFDVRLAAETNGLVFIFKDAAALDSQRAPLLPHAS